MRTAAGRLLIAALGGSFATEMTTFGPQPDRPPGSPTAYDLEFTNSTHGGTLIDSNATFDYDADTSIEDCLYIAASGAVGTTAGLYWAAPSPPYIVTAKIAGYANPMGANTRTDVGLMLGAATPGAFIHGWLDIAEDHYFTICGSKWTNPDTWSTNIGDFLNAGSGSGSRARTPGFALMQPHWSRFVVHSTTNVDGYFSFDGLIYTKWLTAYNPGFTIGSYGIDLHNGSVGSEVDCAVAVDYIRFRLSDSDPTL